MGSDQSRKSCFNCRKRRIVCDLTPPKCKKCDKKGLECPGYGVRYRFTDGQTVLPSEIGPSNGSSAAASTSTRRRNSLKWVNGSNRVRTRRGVEVRDTGLTGGGHSSSPNGTADVQGHTDEIRDHKGAIDGEFESLVVQASVSLDQVAPLGIVECVESDLNSPHQVDASTSLEGSEGTEVTRDGWLAATQTCSTSMLNLPPLLSKRDHRLRLLFNHFSAHVSPVMLMYDNTANGYRHQILPLAHLDPVVERAVCVAAAFHLSSTMPELRLPAEQGRAVIIQKLSAMPLDLSDATWATILVLIVAELVTGHEHVLTLYKILMAFLDARSQAMGQNGLGGDSPLAEFLYYQSRLISFFAYPILGESKVITNISHIFQDPLETFEEVGPRQHMPLEFLVTANEAQASSLALVDSRAQLYIDIVREATTLYLLRVNTPDNNSSTISVIPQPLFPLGAPWSESDSIALRLASIRCLFEKVDFSAPGSHTIVWPAFIAAAESRSDDDREFFTAVLQRIWRSTGYTNVLKGLDALPGIWEQQKHGRNWTSILPTLKTVVM